MCNVWENKACGLDFLGQCKVRNFSPVTFVQMYSGISKIELCNFLQIMALIDMFNTSFLGWNLWVCIAFSLTLLHYNLVFSTGPRNSWSCDQQLSLLPCRFTHRDGSWAGRFLLGAQGSTAWRPRRVRMQGNATQRFDFGMETSLSTFSLNIWSFSEALTAGGAWKELFCCWTFCSHLCT